MPVPVCDIHDCPKHPLSTLDHIVPRSEGGSNATNNLITCCMRCNRLRGNCNWSKFALQLARRGQPDGVSQAVLTRLIRAAVRPTRYRIRRVLTTNWGF